MGSYIEEDYVKNYSATEGLEYQVGVFHRPGRYLVNLRWLEELVPEIKKYNFISTFLEKFCLFRGGINVDIINMQLFGSMNDPKIKWSVTLHYI